MKKLLGGLLLVVSVQGGLWAAACSDKITLKFSFKEQKEVKVQLEDGIFVSATYPLPIIEQFETLKNLLEDLGDDEGAIPVSYATDDGDAIPVPYGTQQQFDILVEMLDLDNPKNAIPADYNCKQVADLLNLAMLLDNKKIQNALALGLFKKLNQLSTKGLPTPEQQDAFNFIANANDDMFYAMSIALIPLLEEGAAIDYGVPFEEATYFVFKRLDEDGNAVCKWDKHGNPVVEQGLIKSIMQVIQEEPEGSYSIDQFYKDIQVNPAGAGSHFAIIPAAKSFIIKMFLGRSPAWKDLNDDQKQLLINIFSYALTSESKDILTYKCIDLYPELVNQRLKKGYTPLMLATTRMRTSPEQIALVQKILALSPGTINMQNNNGYTALMLATSNNNIAAVQALLGAGADRGIRGNHGYTALMIAISNRNLDIIQALLRDGAAIDIQDNDGYTALMIVSHDNNLAIAQAILNAGANLNIQNNDGNTALMIAIDFKHIAIARALLGAGANPNIQNNYGDTALIKAVVKGNLEIVNMLLDAGAYRYVRNELGKTALSLAQQHRYQAIINILNIKREKDDYCSMQ